MKTHLIQKAACILAIIMGALTPAPLNAAKKKKPKPAPPKEETLLPQTTAKNQIEFVSVIGTSMNSAVLSPIDVKFSRDVRPDLIALRDNLLDESKEKPVASAETYKVAVRLTNAWLSALQERETRRASLGMAAPPVADLEHSKKTTLHFWDDILTFERELKDMAEKQADDKQKQAFFKDADKNNWRLRTDALRPDLEKLYSQFREQRRQGLETKEAAR